MELYVSPQGDDNNPGTSAKPFKTPMRARDAVRLLKEKNGGKTPDSGVTVWLRGGRYELAETFALGPEDSGQQGRPVVYRSYADERSVLSGGRVIRNWQKAESELPGLPEAAKGKVWVAEAAEAKNGKWPFRQLWADGKRLTRARWPKNGEAQFRLVDGSVPSADALKDAKSRECWEHVLKQSWRTVEAPDEARKAFPKGGLPKDLGNGSAEFITMNRGKWMTIRVPVAGVEWMQMTMKSPLGYLTYYWNGMSMMSNGRGYIENALSLLDRAGEWYLDRNAGLVYYLPEDGVDPNTEEIVAPALEQLICLRGTHQAPVEFVELRGLRLEHGEWPLPEFGYRPMLGCYHGTQSSPLFFLPPFLPLVGGQGIPVGSVRPRDEYPEYCLPAAVDLMYARDCLLELCRVKHVGASGIGLGEGCRSNRVVGCEVSDAGGHGIHAGLAHGPVCGEDFAWKDAEDEPRQNEILNCRVHHTGQMDWGAFGIMSAYCRGTRIAHNLVEQQPYSGICACFTTFAFPSGREEDVTVEYNHVRDVMQKLHDGGGIYTKDGVAKTSALRGNLVQNVGGCRWGIYLDDGTYGFHLEDNVLDNATLHINGVRGVKREHFTWGKNYIGDPNYPRALAENAGIEEPYRRLLNTNE